MESRFEFFENSLVTECFCVLFHFETKDDDRKKAKRATQRNGEIKKIISVTNPPVIIPSGIVSNFFHKFRNNKGRFKIIPQNSEKMR
jgi:hypothetical protein